MPNTENDDRISQLTLVHDEIERQIADVGRRAAAMDSRAGVLVAAAGIAATLIGSAGKNGWVILAVAAALVSATCGVIALLPRLGKSLSAERVRDQVSPLSTGNALIWMINAKLGLQPMLEMGLTRKARFLQAGFLLFAVSIIFTFLSVTSVQVTI